MNPITVTPTGAGYAIEHAGKRSGYLPRTDSVAVHVVMLAIARAPHPVTPTDARRALCLRVEDLPSFQRRWKSRVAGALGRLCPALADELRERLTIGADVAAFDDDGALGVPVRVAAEKLFVPTPRRRPNRVTVLPTSTEVARMRVLTLIPCLQETDEGPVMHEAGSIFDCTNARLLAERPDWLPAVRDITSEADALDEEVLVMALQTRLRPWGSTRVDG